MLPLLLSCSVQSEKAQGNVGTYVRLEADRLTYTVPAKPNSAPWQKSSAGTPLLFTPGMQFSFLGDVAPLQLWRC